MGTRLLKEVGNLHKFILRSLWLFSLWGLELPLLAQQPLTLQNYLDQVETLNPQIRAIDLTLQSMGEKVLELDMVYSPLLSASYAYTDDKSGVGFGSTFPTDEMKATQWTASLAKKFSTGTALNLGMTDSTAIFDLLYPTQVEPFHPPTTHFSGYEIKPYVELQQSLLRDFIYGLTQAGIDKAKAGVRTGQYQQLFKKQQILLNAQMTYWKLVLASEVASFRKTSLDRTEKLLHWNENRVRLDLADAGDLYQAQAAYKSRQLNYQLALEAEIKARRDFNELIGNTTEAIAGELEKITDKVDAYSDITELIRTGDRADVLSARASYRSSELANQETFYRSLPELSLTGAYSLHGLDLTSQAAWEQVTQSEKPTYSLMLSLLVPLDFWTLSKVREGYRKDYESSQQQLAQAELDAQNQWADLAQTWRDVKARIALAKEIRSIQEKRLANEQKRFQLGRSTTFQVLTAENDLDDATLNVYSMVFEELVTAAQAELFNTPTLE